jgi:transcriptional regulator with XRE-family HTH domain
MRIRNRQVLGAYIGLLGLSEREFATMAGLSHATVNHLLTGRRGSCSVGTAVAIETALRCPAGLLFEQEGVSRPAIRSD